MPTDPATDSAEPNETQSAGGVLRQARREKDLSEKDVADRLHITVHYLKALETDRFEKLPGAVFVKGYIKSYAQLLRLDSAALLAAYEADQAQRKATQEQQQLREVRHSRDRNRPFVIASLMLFIGVFAGLWLISLLGDEATQSEQTPAPAAAGGAEEVDGRQAMTQNTAALQPASISPAQSLPPDVAFEPVADNAAETGATTPTMSDVPVSRIERPVAAVEQAVNPAVTGHAEDVSSPAAGAPGQEAAADSEDESPAGERLIEVQRGGEDVLRISFAGDSWVEVIDGRQQRIYRDLRRAGDVLEISGDGPFNVLLGDAPLTRLEFNGDEVDVSDDVRVDNSARLTVGL